MGLAFLLETAYLLPLTLFMVTVSRANRRRGYGPFVAGTLAGGLLVVGKFFIESDTMIYASVAGLIAASVWNAWPVKSVTVAPAGTLLELGGIKKETEDGNETKDRDF